MSDATDSHEETFAASDREEAADSSIPDAIKLSMAQSVINVMADTIIRQGDAIENLQARLLAIAAGAAQ